MDWERQFHGNCAVIFLLNSLSKVIIVSIEGDLHIPAVITFPVL